MINNFLNFTKMNVKLSNDFKSALRHFVYYYTNGTLPYVIGDETILSEIDYREILKYEASLVEMVFAIYSNNIEMDGNGKVINHTLAMRRAAQWIRLVCRNEGEEYEVIPPFEEWETYLY